MAGKTHYIADALSRYPVFGPAEDNFNVYTAIKCLRSLTAELESLKSIYTKQNEAYKLVMTELRNNADFSQLPNDHPARAYKNIQNRDEQGNEVMLKDSQKIVVPRGAQDEILKELHRSHSGILKTYTTAILLAWHEKLNEANDRVMRVMPERQAKQAKNNNSHISIFKSSVTHETCGSRFI